MKTVKALAAMVLAATLSFGITACVPADQPSGGSSDLTQADKSEKSDSSTQELGDETYFESEEGNNDNDL